MIKPGPKSFLKNFSSRGFVFFFFLFFLIFVSFLKNICFCFFNIAAGYEAGHDLALARLEKIAVKTGLVTSFLCKRVTDVTTGCLVTTVLRRLTVRLIGRTGNLRGCATRSADTIEGAVVSGNFMVEV
jgi:hypothetical protein